MTLKSKNLVMQIIADNIMELNQNLYANVKHGLYDSVVISDKYNNHATTSILLEWCGDQHLKITVILEILPTIKPLPAEKITEYLESYLNACIEQHGKTHGVSIGGRLISQFKSPNTNEQTGMFYGDFKLDIKQLTNADIANFISTLCESKPELCYDQGEISDGLDVAFKPT